MLYDLIRSEDRPEYLTEIAYEWCSVICENHQSLEGWQDLLLLSLEIGFRHFDPLDPYLPANITHTEHHRAMVDVVFESRRTEAIADLLHAWTTRGDSFGPARGLLGICTGHLVGLHNLVSFSQRLRGLMICSVELIGYEGFEGVGVERFAEMLDHLYVTVEDMDERNRWAILLLKTLQSPEGTRCLSHWYWKLLAELAIVESQSLRGVIAYRPQIMTSLIEAQEWSKLECWIATACALWPLGPRWIIEEDLGRSMELLFRQLPGAAWNLEQWMEQWSQIHGAGTPWPLQRIWEQAREVVQQDAL